MNFVLSTINKFYYEQLTIETKNLFYKKIANAIPNMFIECFVSH